ncbi:predicted protein [Histoplasma capsulatum var. duboisii H88]|uniref:Predicted protein n=2 Tax=Ajellomyces capsulatus TaxID=5037 RepID=F0URW1_AJEC8|nr:predicted protein [Histoplasma capsulatum H143]EGC48638.1 predicted protein [Histoplasma capsulatum var. duboisii H88]
MGLERIEDGRALLRAAFFERENGVPIVIHAGPDVGKIGDKGFFYPHTASLVSLTVFSTNASSKWECKWLAFSGYSVQPTCADIYVLYPTVSARADAYLQK